ncbi:hypothetical protein VQ02_32795, partial [Methylobacterium variabile]
SFQSSITGDLFRQLNGSISPITIPNISGIGSYSHVQNSAFGSALNLSQTQQSVSPVVVQQGTAQPDTSSTIVYPSKPGTTTGTGFEGIMQ